MRKPTDIIYGLNPAFEVLRAKRRTVLRAWIAVNVFHNPRIKKLKDMLAFNHARVEQVSKEIVARKSQSMEHQGVALEVSLYPYAAFSDLLEKRRLLLLDNLEDPQNLGAILRSAEIFGWKNVLLPNKGVPEIYASVVKASAGATEHLYVCRESGANAYVRSVLEAGFQVWVLDSRGKSDLRVLADALPDKVLLVIGGEHHAVGQHIVNQAQQVIGIPQSGMVSSLNASVAAGIALYELRHKV